MKWQAVAGVERAWLGEGLELVTQPAKYGAEWRIILHGQGGSTLIRSGWEAGETAARDAAEDAVRDLVGGWAEAVRP